MGNCDKSEELQETFEQRRVDPWNRKCLSLALVRSIDCISCTSNPHLMRQAKTINSLETHAYVFRLLLKVKFCVSLC